MSSKVIIVAAHMFPKSGNCVREANHTHKQRTGSGEGTQRQNTTDARVRPTARCSAWDELLRPSYLVSFETAPGPEIPNGRVGRANDSV